MPLRAQLPGTSCLARGCGPSEARHLGRLATYLEVLDAQQQLNPAEFALAQTERDPLLAVVALYRALGGGWNAYHAEPEVPLPIVP